MYGFGDPELALELARLRMQELQESARRVSLGSAPANIVHAVFPDEGRLKVRSQRSGERSLRGDGPTERHEAAS